MSAGRRSSFFVVAVSVALALWLPGSVDRSCAQQAGAVSTAYTVQVGAFADRDNAEALLAEVQRVPADAAVVAVNVDGKNVYRVLSGVFASQAEANDRQRVLRAKGFSTFVRSAPREVGAAATAAAPADIAVPAAVRPDARDRDAAGTVTRPDAYDAARNPAPVPSASQPSAVHRSSERAGVSSPPPQETEQERKNRALKLVVGTIESARRAGLASGLDAEPAE